MAAVMVRREVRSRTKSNAVESRLWKSCFSSPCSLSFFLCRDSFIRRPDQLAIAAGFLRRAVSWTSPAGACIWSRRGREPLP